MVKRRMAEKNARKRENESEREREPEMALQLAHFFALNNVMHANTWISDGNQMGKHTTIILSAAANQGKWIVSMNLLKRFMWNCFHASQEIGQIMKCVSCESVSMMSQIKSAMMASLPCKNTQWRNKTKQWVWIVALGFFVMQLFNGLDQCERENTDDTKKKKQKISGESFTSFE